MCHGFWIFGYVTPWILAFCIGVLEKSEQADSGGLTCGTGLYDTWVARDVCGTPFRAFWPYVADPPSQLAIRNQEPFEVSSCWNGAVVFDAKPFLYAHNTSSSTDVSYPPAGSDLGLSKRGWKMVDNCESLALHTTGMDGTTRCKMLIPSSISHVPRCQDVASIVIAYPIPYLRYRSVRPLGMFLTLLRPTSLVLGYGTPTKDRDEPCCKSRIREELVSLEPCCPQTTDREMVAE